MSLSDPNTPVHSSKGRLVVTRVEPRSVALAEYLKEQFRAGAWQGRKAQLVDDQRVQTRELFL